MLCAEPWGESPSPLSEESCGRPFLPAGAEDRHIWGRAGLSSEWDPGEAPLSERGPVWSGRGWEGAVTLLVYFTH